MNVFILTAVLFILDFVYLKTGIVDYFGTIAKIQGAPFVYNYAGLLVYPIMSMGINHFAKSAFDSALLGFFAFSIFNLTNVFMFKDWSSAVALTDTTWGTLLFYISFLITKMF